MRTIGAFTLNLDPTSEAIPARVSIALTGGRPDERGVLHLTPDCITLDELEGRINQLQHELDGVDLLRPRITALESDVTMRNLSTEGF